MNKDNYDTLSIEKNSNGIGDKIKLSSSETAYVGVKQEEAPINNAGNKFVNKFKNLFSGSTNEQANAQSTQEMDCKTKVIKKLEETIEVEKSYKVFFILLSIGLGLICLSLMFLPVIVAVPSKFVMCFSFGSLLIITSFIFMYGTRGYFELLFSRSRFGFTLLFLASILIGFYFAWGGHYLMSVVCAVFQMISLIVFVLSFIPGGSVGISCIKNSLSSPFLRMWLRMKGQSYLPS